MRYSIAFTLLFQFFYFAPVQAADIRIGVLAPRGNAAAIKRWFPLAEYLRGRLPEHLIHIMPLDLHQMDEAVAKHYVDFVLTNTGDYVKLEHDYGVNCIATLRNLSLGRPTTQFGAVLFIRAGRFDIKNMRDLKGKKLMGVSKDAFGGFQMVWREMKQAGIDPFRELKLSFSGMPQDKIVYAVRDRKVDAGVVRTDTLERMQSEGKIDINEFVVINPRRGRTPLPFQLSTRLYPEWPFAKTAYTDVQLAKEIAVALLTMPEDDPAAVSGNYAGWTVPLDYSDVHQMFRELRIGPYSTKPSALWMRIKSLNSIYVAAVVLLVSFGLILIWQSFHQAKRVRKRPLPVHPNVKNAVLSARTKNFRRS